MSTEPMVPVPVRHIQALKSLRDLDERMLEAERAALAAVLACVPKPIEVGNRVRTPAGFVAHVVAVEGDDAWVRYDSGRRFTWRIEDLEVL